MGSHEELEERFHNSYVIWIYLPEHVEGGVVVILGVIVGTEVVVVFV